MNNIVLRLFIFILVFSPLAFGTVEEWSLAVMEILSLFALWLLVIRKSKERDLSLREVPGIIPLLMFLGYMLLQIIPLPAGIVRLVSAGTFSLYTETAGLSEPLSWITLSIHRKATLNELLKITACGAFYVLTIQLLSNREALKKTVTVLIIFASALSFFAVLQHFLFNGKIYWMRELTQGGTPFGPYVNRNHYAGLMGMIFPVVVGIFLYYKPDFSYGSFRERMADFFNQRTGNIHILLGSAAVLIAFSIFLSLSRGGIISLSISMLFFGLMLLLKGKKRKRGILIILIFILIAYAVGWIGWEPIFERFERIRSAGGDIAEQRLFYWKDSAEIIRDFPVTGTGFGSFVSIYPKYRTRPGDSLVDHAHNDYLELFTDGGMIGFILVCWFVLAVFTSSFRSFIRRRDPYSLYLFIGAMTGMIAILIHSVTDFNLHIGANGLYFFFLAGLTVSAANTRLQGDRATYLKKLKFASSKKTIVLSSFLLVLIAAFNVSFLTARLYHAPLENEGLSRIDSREELAALRERAYRASLFDPQNDGYHFATAQADRLLLRQDRALGNYRKAVILNPANGEYLQMFGLILSERNDRATAEKFLRAGTLYDKKNPRRHQVYASWLLTQGMKADAVPIVREAMSLEPRKTGEYIAFMVLNGMKDEEIRDVLPERAETYIRYGDYLQRVGREQMAEEAYFEALEYAVQESGISPSAFFRIHNFYRKRGLKDSALTVMRKAVEKFPEDIRIRLTAARSYEEMDLVNRAVGEYRKALIIDPDNGDAKKRLERLLGE